MNSHREGHPTTINVVCRQVSHAVSKNHVNEHHHHPQQSVNHAIGINNENEHHPHPPLHHQSQSAASTARESDRSVGGINYCTKCNYKTTKKSNLTKHLKYKHNLNITFKCVICVSSLGSADALYKHKRDEYSDIFRYTSDAQTCNYYTDREDHLIEHKKSMHEIKNKRCSICDEMWNLEYDYKKHTDERLISMCLMSSYMFTQA